MKILWSPRPQQLSNVDITNSYCSTPMKLLVIPLTDISFTKVALSPLSSIERPLSSPIFQSGGTCAQEILDAQTILERYSDWYDNRRTLLTILDILFDSLQFLIGSIKIKNIFLYFSHPLRKFLLIPITLNTTTLLIFHHRRTYCVQ